MLNWGPLLEFLPSNSLPFWVRVNLSLVPAVQPAITVTTGGVTELPDHREFQSPRVWRAGMP